MYASDEDLSAWCAFSVLPDGVGMGGGEQDDFAAFLGDRQWAVEPSEAPVATGRCEDGKGMLDVERCIDRLSVEADLASLIQLFGEEEREKEEDGWKEHDVSSDGWGAESESGDGESDCEGTWDAMCAQEREEESGEAREREARRREELERGLASLLPSVDLDRTGLARGLPVGLGRVTVAFGSGSKVVVLPVRGEEEQGVRRSARLGGSVRLDEEGEPFEPVRQFESLERVWEEPRFESSCSLARELSRPVRTRYRAWATRRWLEKRRVREGKARREEARGRVGATLRVLRKRAQSNGNRFGKFVIPTVGKAIV